MRRAILATLVFGACTPAAMLPPTAPPAEEPRPGVRVVVLGVAQDGGMPHIGCTQEACRTARHDPSRRERVASIGLVDDLTGARFLVDATPDFASQLESLNANRPNVDRARPVDGILLTHAHIGHYTGLMYLGREALGARGVVVYASPRMAHFLTTNGPWSQLVALHNIELREIVEGEEIPPDAQPPGHAAPRSSSRRAVRHAGLPRTRSHASGALHPRHRQVGALGHADRRRGRLFGLRAPRRDVPRRRGAPRPIARRGSTSFREREHHPTS